MNTNRSGGAEHHASAAGHHEDAANFHHQASMHYEIGKDYAHAAHQALVAHGHAMQAIEHANHARDHYPDYDDGAFPKKLTSVPQRSPLTLQIPSIGEISLNNAQHHAAAKHHNERAAEHHAKAAKHFTENDYGLAAGEAQIAHGYAKHGVFHSNEAAKLHVEHYGRAKPTAQLA
jgi:hypothetical protein